MKLKSHFKFSNSQRNGVFLLAILIIIFQCIYAFVDFSSQKVLIDTDTLEKFRAQIDTLKQQKAKESIQGINRFNPNYLTDFKGYTLGLSPEEIDRLFEFRANNQWINSAKQFQEVTQISDSLLAVLQPLFAFPQGTGSSKSNTTIAHSFKKNDGLKTFDQKADLNTATARDLQRVYGIGEKLSDRIVKYRNTLKGGFISEIQLEDVYGLSPEVIERLKHEFAVKTPPMIQKINLNTATRDELVTIQHIDYEIAHYIIEQRTLREGFKSFDELIKVKNFPVQKIEIIKLYLTLD